MLDIEFPRKLEFLLTIPARLKILYGGRGGGKSINAIRAATLFARDRYLEIVCFRELQKSIQESIHGVICNEINSLQLNDEFDIKNNEIVHTLTGSRFTFESLRYNVTKIKSRARIDIALLEEADNISQSSLDILMPTIRSRDYGEGDLGGPFGQGPEIWILFNPKLDTDEVYTRFVLKGEKFAPPFNDKIKVSQDETKWYLSTFNEIADGVLKLSDLNENEQSRYTELSAYRYAIVQKINHIDNPWFPADLRREMELLKRSDEEAWLNIWEGHTQQVLKGAIYAEEIKKVLLDGRRGKVEYDPSRTVNTFWDLGHDDYTSIWFSQQVGMHYNLIGFYQNRLQKIAHYIEHMQNLKYNYGFHYLPHDADNETLAARSVKRILQDSYPGKVRVVPRVSKKVVGIRAGRQIFDLCNFDEVNTADGWQCLCRYQYDVDKDGLFSQNPRHDEYSHGADAFQSLALTLKPEQAAKKPVIISTNRSATYRPNANSWMES